MAPKDLIKFRQVVRESVAKIWTVDVFWLCQNVIYYRFL